MGFKNKQEAADDWDKPLIGYLSRLANQTAIRCEMHKSLVIAIISALYFCIIGLVALRKQLENDELFTLNIARLPSLGHVWSALSTGAEQQPLLFYLITRGSLALFGESGLALRLPAILGVWVMCLSLFYFVSKRTTPLTGMVAMQFPLTTGAYFYAFEARPYGLVLGFSGLALICWQSIGKGISRSLPVVGFCACIAAAISCHYYAVLVLVPFIIGEIARQRIQRHLDYTIWVFLAASLTPLLFHWPLIKSASAYSTAFWARGDWHDLPDFYMFLLSPTALPLTAILVLASGRIFFRVDAEKSIEMDSGTGFPIPEAAVAFGFIAVPAIAVAMALLVTHAFTNRYALCAVLGFAVVVPFGLRLLVGRNRALLLLSVILLALSFAGRGEMTLQASALRIMNREKLTALLNSQLHRDLPIVCADSHTFLVLSHYTAPDLRSRLVYLADPQSSMRYLGHDSLDKGTLDLLRPWFRLNVQKYKTFLATEDKFLICGDPDHFLNWVMQDLILSGMNFELVGRQSEAILFLVSRPGSQ